MKRILLTGMFGTGKSTVIRELAARGYKAVDADGDEFSQWVEVEGSAGAEVAPVDGKRDWMWREDRMQALLPTEDTEVLFVSGCAENMPKFFPRFDLIVLLSAPASVIVQRLRTKTTNQYGKRLDEVARIATLSHNGRPSINPLYFVYLNGRIWLGTVEWTLAARNVKADPRVSVLFEVEQDRSPHRVLRISGRACVRTEPKVQRSYNLRVERKYVLKPGGICHYLAHLRQLPLMHNYHAQAAEKGQACVIEVTPLEAEFLGNEKLG